MQPVQRQSYKRSERGSVIGQMLISVLILSGITTTIYTSTSSTTNLIQRARVSSAMSLTALKLKIFLHNPLNYYCETPPCTSSQVKLSSYFNSNVEKVISNIGLPPCNEPICGIRIENSSINTDGLRTFTARIKYYGKLSFRDISVSEIIPDSVLGGNNFICSDAEPVLTGIDENGNIVCRPLPSNPSNPCPPGQYVSGIDNRTLNVTCTEMGRLIDCSASDQVISSIQWNGGSSTVSHTCSSRAEAFSYFDYSTIDTTTSPSPMNGQCGGAQGAYNSTDTSFRTPLCNVGSAMPASPLFPATGSTRVWTCTGVAGGTDATCSATRAAAATPVDGECGSAMGSYLATDTTFRTPFCNAGSPFPATPSFPAQGSSSNWNCNGTSGGANVSCTANRDAAPGSCPVGQTSKWIATCTGGTACSSHPLIAKLSLAMPPASPGVQGAIVYDSYPTLTVINGSFITGPDQPCDFAHENEKALANYVSCSGLGPCGTPGGLGFICRCSP